MKHVGRMKNNGAKIAVAYRTIPGDPHSCLVIATNGLPDAFHDAFMSVLESDSGQQADELADILTARRFPDGSNMLGYLHTNNLLTKVKTSAVNILPNNNTSISLDELNLLIAQQKGIALEELAVKSESGQRVPVKNAEPVKIEEAPAAPKQEFELTPTELRSRADALFKQAQQLRKKADELDPPKKKAKAEKVEQ